ncbi:MAG: DegT/DnrJ/EryC1/StrS family aminotransferase [Clostridiales bacterium]|nr:DegT/DnrJ/EryC1/StrS family aminotransferase [Clostridiales bacterium]
MNIPLIDLKAQYNSIKNDLDNATLEVLSSAGYIMGNKVINFEKQFSEFVGAKYAISVGNGTDALIIALKAIGIKEGDEVITSPFTFFATAESISAVGGVPVFVDVRKDTFTIDPNKIEEKITSKTKAIMPVHIFGQSADMDEINSIAKKHNLKVIEDACQAVGGKYKGRKIGSLGDVACFSFFPTKNLGCAGDGGMIVTSDENIATIAKALRTHGSGENGQKAYNLLNNIDSKIDTVKNADDTVYNPLKYYNYLIGYNSRLDAIQASILLEKIKYIDKWNAKRREIAEKYNESLKDTEFVLPTVDSHNEHVYHMYILQSDHRDKIIEKLKDKGIATGVYYPVPLHLQKVYSSLGYKEGDMKVAEYLSHRTFAIPVYPELSDEQIDYIINSIKEIRFSNL